MKIVLSTRAWTQDKKRGTCALDDCLPSWGAPQDQDGKDEGGPRGAVRRRHGIEQGRPGFSLPEPSGREREQELLGRSQGEGCVVKASLRMTLWAPAWTPLGQAALCNPCQQQGGASDLRYTPPRKGFRECRHGPQNKAATEAKSSVIELRIFLKLEGEAD